MKIMTYLGTPYTHLDKNVMKFRFELVSEAAAFLIKQGYDVFSPISHCHPINEHIHHPEFEFWKAYNLRMIRACDTFSVLEIEGVLSSRGLTEEIRFAQDLKKPIWTIAFNPLRKVKFTLTKPA